MSVTSPIPDENGLAWTALGQQCFYCARALCDPAIHWMGHGGDLFLHRDCVFALFVRLCRDVHELDCPQQYRQSRTTRRRAA